MTSRLTKSLKRDPMGNLYYLTQGLLRAALIMSLPDLMYVQYGLHAVYVVVSHDVS
jgi:hypothetical protein